MCVKLYRLNGKVTASGSNIRCAVNVKVIRALGNLVRIHLPPRSAHIHLRSRSIPSTVAGSSCVALLNLAGNTTSATHGALLLTTAVVTCINGFAFVACGVGVHAKREGKSSSGTSTSPPQLLLVHVAEGVVDVVAEYERQRVVATPTTPITPIDCVAMVPSSSHI